MRRPCPYTVACSTPTRLRSGPATRSRISRSAAAGRRPAAGSRSVTIPVVVHVVWHAEPENIDDAQVRSQLDMLNADFRARNADVAGVPASVAEPGRRRQGGVRAGHGGPDRGRQHRDHPYPDGGDRLRPRRRRQVVRLRRGHRLARRPLPQHLGLPAEQRPARVRPVPRRAGRHRRRGAAALGGRYARHGGRPVQPWPHRDARGRALAQPAAHLGRRRRRVRAARTSSTTRPTRAGPTTARPRSRRCPATTARTETCS